MVLSRFLLRASRLGSLLLLANTSPPMATTPPISKTGHACSRRSVPCGWPCFVRYRGEQVTQRGGSTSRSRTRSVLVPRPCTAWRCVRTHRGWSVDAAATLTRGLLGMGYATTPCIFRLTVLTLRRRSGRRRWGSGPRGTRWATRSVVHGKCAASSGSSNGPLVHRRPGGPCRGRCAKPDTPRSTELAG